MLFMLLFVLKSPMALRVVGFAVRWLALMGGWSPTANVDPLTTNLPPRQHRVPVPAPGRKRIKAAGSSPATKKHQIKSRLVAGNQCRSNFRRER